MGVTRMMWNIIKISRCKQT